MKTSLDAREANAGSFADKLEDFSRFGRFSLPAVQWAGLTASERRRDYPRRQTVLPTERERLMPLD